MDRSFQIMKTGKKVCCEAPSDPSIVEKVRELYLESRSSNTLDIEVSYAFRATKWVRSLSARIYEA